MIYFDPHHFPPPQKDRTQPPLKVGRFFLVLARIVIVGWVIYGTISFVSRWFGGAR